MEVMPLHFAYRATKNERFQTATKKMIDKSTGIRQDVFNRKSRFWSCKRGSLPHFTRANRL
ncbi:MAG: hypothetical protein WCA89_07955, partial [Terracidiphilus sp.]